MRRCCKIGILVIVTSIASGILLTLPGDYPLPREGASSLLSHSKMQAASKKTDTPVVIQETLSFNAEQDLNSAEHSSPVKAGAQGARDMKIAEKIGKLADLVYDQSWINGKFQEITKYVSLNATEELQVVEMLERRAENMRLMYGSGGKSMEELGIDLAKMPTLRKILPVEKFSEYERNKENDFQIANALAKSEIITAFAGENNLPEDKQKMLRDAIDRLDVFKKQRRQELLHEMHQARYQGVDIGTFILNRERVSREAQERFLMEAGQILTEEQYTRLTAEYLQNDDLGTVQEFINFALPKSAYAQQ